MVQMQIESESFAGLELPLQLPIALGHQGRLQPAAEAVQVDTDIMKEVLYRPHIPLVTRIGPLPKKVDVHRRGVAIHHLRDKEEKTTMATVKMGDIHTDLQELEAAEEENPILPPTMKSTIEGIQSIATKIEGTEVIHPPDHRPVATASTGEAETTTTTILTQMIPTTSSTNNIPRNWTVAMSI